MEPSSGSARRAALRTETGSGMSCTHSNAIARSAVRSIAAASPAWNRTRSATPASAAWVRACSIEYASGSKPSTTASGVRACERDRGPSVAAADVDHAGGAGGEPRVERRDGREPGGGQRGRGEGAGGAALAVGALGAEGVGCQPLTGAVRLDHRVDQRAQ